MKFDKWDHAFMRCAFTFAELSSAKRLQVGAISVKDNRIISIGYNGMPSGWSNVCEEIEYDKKGKILTEKTRPEVTHAEANCIAKLAKSNESGDGSTMYVTHAPCIECAKQIYGAGIKQVYYAKLYGNNDGINFLKQCGVKINNLKENKHE